MELENAINQQSTSKNIVDSRRNKTVTTNKMKQLRERYNQLFFKSNNPEIKHPQELSKQQKELIDSVILKVEETINEMTEIQKSERRRQAYAILLEIKKLEGLNLTVEQAEKLHYLMQSSVLDKLNISMTDKLDFNISKARKSIVRKLAEAIDIAHSQIEDIEELKELGRKITTKMALNNQIVVGAIKTKIDNKIFKIQQKIMSNKIRNNVSTNISSIVKDIALGRLDVEKANEIIDSEAKLRVESKPKTRFSLTQEQEKRQIFIQIRTVLVDKADQYCIENPEIVVIQLQNLFGGELEQSLRTVVKNLTNRKKFAEAKQVCDSFSKKNDENTMNNYIHRLREEIRNEEIGDAVLKGINMEGTLEKQNAYYELIEKGLKYGNVKLGAISLGKSQDGMRTITLADIWSEKEKSR